MDFVFCTDKNYLKGYGVLMLSILRFTPPPTTERLRFHVLSDDLDDADKRLLEGIAARREGAEVRFYSPAKLLSQETLKSIDESLNANRYTITAATFYRILAPDLLPPDVHRALYIDGDVVCTGNLEELFNTDLKGCPAGMCLSGASFGNAIDSYNRLGYPPSEGYFPPSLLLYDLDLWRKEKLTQAMLDYLKQNAKRLLQHDMDLINAVLHGRIFLLDFAANVLPQYFYVFYWLQEEKNNFFARGTQFVFKDDWERLKAAVERPLSVHFPGSLKPWHRECDHPFTPVWRYFCAQSPWANEPLKRYSAQLSAKARIKRLGRKALERLNLVTPIPYPQEAYAAAQGILDKLIEEDARI